MDWDLDGDGKLNDVDAVCSTATLKTAIEEWAADAGELIVFLVDHGGVGTFCANAGDIVLASDLDSWLDTAQGHHSRQNSADLRRLLFGQFSGVYEPAGGKGKDRGRQLPGGQACLVLERRDPVLRLPVLGVGCFSTPICADPTSTPKK